MNKTKETIAYECTSGIFDEHELGITGLSKAMDEYAKQESIEYRKFCQSEIKTIMAHILTEVDEDFDTIAYKLYIKSKTK